jgi:hypothetical protein
MRRWGVLITLAYALILVLFLAPLAALLDANFRGSEFSRSFLSNIKDVYRAWGTWMFVGIAVAAQALLLFLSVDTSFKKLRPRAHIATSALLTASASALLSSAAILCIGFGIWDDRFGGKFFDKGLNVLLAWLALWLIWAIVFSAYFRSSGSLISQATSWLVRGSVLELLIAVPAHVIVRRRNDCSAPVATSFGIITGIAVMFLCFGPSVLLLYNKRMREYPTRKAAAG